MGVRELKFSVAQEVFQALPQACFGVVVARNISMQGDFPAVRQRLAESVARVEAAFDGKNVKEAQQITPYRDAFLTLGMNPNKFQSSIEAMVSRVAKKKGLPNINPVVDLSNSVSLKYLVPLGAHDLDQADDDIEVRFSFGGEQFRPFGQADIEVLEPGELIYTVGQHVRTRRWIWRQSELGKITEQSKNIFFPIDGFTGLNDTQVKEARTELALLLQETFCCDVTIGFVNQKNMEYVL
jgi:DNA/RNA-binding domain of Phe-tRNA-synthetase-like protein